jgi:hypothetical protein
MLSQFGLIANQISQCVWPVADAGPFKYEPLPTPQAKQSLAPPANLLDNPGLGDISIRLLKVLPARRDGRICVQIREDRLSNRTYKCLSYAWGEPSQKTHAINLNGYEFRVRDNLYQFLQLASERFPNVLLWIDAISINQADDDEKGHQVSHMCHIYRNALETFIWLGNSPGLDAVSAWLNAGVWDAQGRNINLDVREQLAMLCRHPYWERAWITQEITESRALRMLYKRWEIDWKVFGTAVKLPRVLEDIHDYAFIILRFQELWMQQRSSNTRQSIWQLLTWRETALCTDLRDRIYSVLSLSRVDRVFRASYTISTVDLFWAAGEHFGAWAQPRLITTLMRALELKATDLNFSVEKRPDLELSMSIRRVSFSSLLRTKAGCSSPSCVAYPGIPAKSRRDLVLCTHFVDIQDFDCRCLHVHVHPTKNWERKRNELVLTLPSRDGIVTYPLSPDNLQRRETFAGSFETMDWTFIKDNLPEGSVEKGLWTLRLPASIVLDFVRRDRRPT